MDSFKIEIIRILVFLAIISLVVFLKWWAILIVFIGKHSLNYRY